MHRKALHTTRALSLSFGVLALGLTLGLAGHSPQADADGAGLASSVPAAATETTDRPRRLDCDADCIPDSLIWRAFAHAPLLLR